MYSQNLSALAFAADFPPAATEFINVRTAYASEIWAQLTKIISQNKHRKIPSTLYFASGVLCFYCIVLKKSHGKNC